MIPAYSSASVTAIARAYAESNMTAVVSIVRKYAPQFDPLTGSLEAAAPAAVYTGKARIYPASGPLTYSFGDEPSYFSQAIISIPVVTAQVPRVDDLIMVTASPGDPAMVGRTFAVRDVEAGGQWSAARRLQVHGVQESQQWVFPFAQSFSSARASAAGGSGAMVGT